MAQTSNLEATRIIGGVGCGKTQALIKQARRLLGMGVDPSSVLVACATPQAAQAFRQRLSSACGEGVATNVTVTTPRAIALDVLSDAEARRWSGREPRLLTAYEELFLLEDMKVSGLRPKRLREMLKFFYRSWTELADDDEKWLLAGEEATVHKLLKANLAFTQAIVEPEAANLAVNYLRTHDGARTTHSFAHVVVDDYQLISKASQTLAGLLARESVTIAGDRVACVSVYDSYPYAVGIDEFAAEYDCSDIVLTASHRCPASAHAAKKLLADPAIASSDASISENSSSADAAASDGSPESSASADSSDTVTLLAFDQPEDEFVGVGDYVAQCLSEGYQPEDIVIATPNGVWSRNVAKALSTHSVPVEVLADRQPVRGDVRDNAKCIPARILTALDLVADPANALAWRCWCGYNDWLTNSSAFSSLRAYADENNLGLVDTLKRTFGCETSPNAAGADEIVGAQRVADAYQAGLALIEETRGLEGKQLLDKIVGIVSDSNDEETPSVIRDLCLAKEDAHGRSDDSARAMAHRFRNRLLSPNIADEHALRVLPYDQCVGISPKVLIVAGFVNGFIPCRAYFDGAAMPLDKQEREHEKDVRRVYSLVGKANERLIISRFCNTDLESAGYLKLHIGRIRLRDGVRTCQIPPSDFIEQLS